MKNQDYKYDVAFAFMQKDEFFVSQINRLLKEKFTTFFYSKKQEEFTNQIGEILFRETFEKQARTVVLFYRNKWGTTAWTAIEEKAIRTRASEKGFDFLLVVKLDNTSSIPRYLPQSKVWTELSDRGVLGAVDFIEEFLLSKGAGKQNNSLAATETTLKPDPQFEVERSKFLQAVSGLEIAELELKKLFTALENQTKKITETDPNILLSIKKDDRSCEVKYGNRSIKFYLLSEKGSLRMDSPLYFELQEEGDSLSGFNILAVDEFHFELIKVGVYGWSRSTIKDSFISSKQLAEESISILTKQN